MSENLTIHRGYQPRLIDIKNVNSDVKSSLRKLRFTTIQCTPCKSLKGIKATFWNTEPTDRKETGILVRAQKNRARDDHCKQFYIGVYDATDLVDLKNDATEIAQYSTPSLEVALKGLVSFLYPEDLSKIYALDEHLFRPV